MPEHTPTLETLDDVAPRLRRFSAGLIERLRAAGMTVQTTQIYLLSSLSHTIEVPAQVNNVSVQMDFAASFPKWSDRPRARLQVSFDHGRRWFFYERAARDGGLPMTRILELFLRSVIEQDLEAEKLKEAQRKQRNAEFRFQELRRALEFPPHPDPHLLQKGGISLKCLPDSPGRVGMTLIVTHEQAAAIVALLAGTGQSE